MSGQFIDFQTQANYFPNNGFSEEKPNQMTENVISLCMKEIERLAHNMEENGEFEGGTFSRAVLLFNAIKHLRRLEKDPKAPYTPLLMFDEEEEGGMDTLSMDPDDQIKYQIQEGKIFFKEDDAEGWLEHGNNKKAQKPKSKETPEDNKKAQKTKPKKTTKTLPKVPDKVGSTLKTAWSKSYKIIQENRQYELDQHFDSQEFLIEVMESLLPNHSFLNQLKVRSTTKIKIVNDETAEGKWESNQIQDDWVIRIKKEHIESKESGNPFEPTFTQAWRNANKIEEDITLERDGTMVNAKKKDVSWVDDKNKNILVMFPPVPTKDKNGNENGIAPFVKNFHIEEGIKPPTEKNVLDAIDTDGDDTDDEDENENLKDFYYHLSAVICHSGSTTSGGHYYAYVKRRQNENKYIWYKCNDNRVTREDDIVKVLKKHINKKEKRMYMMMYSRDPSTLPTGNPVGLTNYGNTCFANAAMQLLMTIPDVAKIVQSEKEENSKRKDKAKQTTKSVVKKKKRKNSTKSANPARPKLVKSVSAEEEYLSHAPYFVLVGHS